MPCRENLSVEFTEKVLGGQGVGGKGKRQRHRQTERERGKKERQSKGERDRDLLALVVGGVGGRYQDWAELVS